MQKPIFHITLSLVLVTLSSCAGPYPGPDKQFAGMFQGVVTGAGAGAVTGAQLSAGSAPGAAVGAGFGAVAGSVRGLLQDQQEAHLLEIMKTSKEERERAHAHELLTDHYKRRMELHPTRDIFPAEFFFYADEVHLKKDARFVVRELARLNVTRYPWSRFAVTSYVRAKQDDASYAEHLALERARNLAQSLVKAGMNPRRVEARAVIIDSPLVLDPHDSKDRYSQAIELTPLDAR